MFDYYSHPAQVTYRFMGEFEEYKGVAYENTVIDLASGEAIQINDEIEIIHVASSWSPYFLD